MRVGQLPTELQKATSRSRVAVARHDFDSPLDGKEAGEGDCAARRRLPILWVFDEACKQCRRYHPRKYELFDVWQSESCHERQAKYAILKTNGERPLWASECEAAVYIHHPSGGRDHAFAVPNDRPIKPISTLALVPQFPIVDTRFRGVGTIEPVRTDPKRNGHVVQRPMHTRGAGLTPSMLASIPRHRLTRSCGCCAT